MAAIRDFTDPSKLECVKCGNVGFNVTFEPRSEKVTVSGEHLRFHCARCSYTTLHRCIHSERRQTNGQDA